MIVNVADIPFEGKMINFELNLESLYKRVNIDFETLSLDHQKNSSEHYQFAGVPSAQLSLNIQGSTVFVTGLVSTTIITPCSRCAENITTDIVAKISLALKPKQGSYEEDDDIGFGYYTDDVVDCADIAEEHLILQIPQAVTCSAKSVKDCPRASAELKSLIRESKQSLGDERLAIFRTLKAN